MNEQNDIVISKVELVVHRKNLPGDEYGCYINGRGVCGLIVALRGKAFYVFKDGSEQEIEAGQAIIFSDKVAYIVTTKSDEPFEHYTINFSLASGSFLNSDKAIRPVNFASFERKCNDLFNLWRSGEPASRLRCISVLYDLIADFYQNDIIHIIGREAYNKVLPAIHYIDENYFDEINLDSLAKLCIMSKTNFRRTFHAVFGVSPIQYLLSVRIRRAEELLKHSGYTISQIAEKCGFKDYEYFCRTFKKRIGKTAGQLRKPFENHKDYK